MPALIPYNRFAPVYSVQDYSPQDALSFCLASRLAYEKTRNKHIDRRKITERVNSWGFPTVEVFEIVRGPDIDTQGFLAVNNSQVLAAFRGTESLPDWLTNLQTARDPGPWRNTEVHEGFQDAFHAAALCIGEAIGRTCQGRDVWLTGHSLGGALAVLLAATLIESGRHVTGLYTFAAPRVGNQDFAKRLNYELRRKAHWRIVNQGDLVPHLPPELFFSHAGKRQLLTEAGRENQLSSWQQFKKDIWGWIGTAVAKLQIADPHRLDSEVGYLTRLTSDADREATNRA